MKKFWLLFLIPTCGVLLTWCFKKVEENIEQGDSILTWGFSVKQDIENIVEENTEDVDDIYVQNIPIIEEYTIHTWCDKYVNNEFWFQIDLSDWTNDCKITYSDSSYPYRKMISITLWSLPLNNYWRFEWWGDFETIIIIAKDEEIEDKDPLFNYDEIAAENNKYKFYLVRWSASPSFYETYIPSNGNEKFSVFDI